MLTIGLVLVLVLMDYKVGNKVKFDYNEYEILSFSSNGKLAYIKHTIRLFGEKPIMVRVENLGGIVK